MLVYFRYTDARNITVKQLQDYLKQAENRIETMLREKERTFNDKIIPSEVAIERMNRLAMAIQEKLDLFEKNVLQGEDLHRELVQEISQVQQDIGDYQQIRGEFRDIEDRIGNILDMKRQAEEGTTELRELKQKIDDFTQDYQTLTGGIKAQSEKELEGFFEKMQNDLSDYLSKAKEQLSERDEEITTQIQALESDSGSVLEQISGFKEYTQESIESLRLSNLEEFNSVKAISEANIVEIFDMWNKLKEQTQQDKDIIESSYQEQREFFENSEARIAQDLTHFSTSTQELAESLKATLEFSIQEKSHELDTKMSEISLTLDQQGLDTQTRIEQGLQQKINDVNEDLERLHSAFVDQEQSIEDRVRVLGGRVSEGLALGEQSFLDSIKDMQSTLEKTNEFSEQILQKSQEKIDERVLEFEQGFKNQIQENLGRIEKTFIEANQERITQSIGEISSSLENEFNQRYTAKIEEAFKDVEKLQDSIEEKHQYIENIEQKYLQIQDTFNQEKEQILLMVSELEQDRETSLASIQETTSEYINELLESLTESIKETLAEGTNKLTHDQELWQELYNNIIQEARNEFQTIKQTVDKMEHAVANVGETSLATLKRDADRVFQDASFKIDNFKNDISDYLRGTKEDYQEYTDQSKLDMKTLKEDLWNQEKELQVAIQKDLDRLNQKLKEIEKQYQGFIKKSEKLDKTEDLMRKMGQQYQEITELKKDIQNLNQSMKNESTQGIETIKQLQDFKLELDEKSEKLSINSSEADRIQEFLHATIKEAQDTSNLFKDIKVEELRGLLLQNLETSDKLQESIASLEGRKASIEEMMHTIDKSEKDISQVSLSSDEMIRKIDEMGNYAQDIHTQLGQLQTDMRDVAGEQSKLHRAVSSLHELELMIDHIDAEKLTVQRMMDWIAKAQKDVDRIGSKANVPSFTSIQNNQVDESQVKNILGLYEQGWSLSDIATNLNTTQAYVELIIDRYKK